MTDSTDRPDASPDDAATPPPGERVAKVIARAGLGSRREAEAWIEAGRVAVNGQTIDSAARNVTGEDAVTVDGRPLPARERTRLWLYHKPRGYVTTTHDPEGRETVFEILPPAMPRVVTIGRLDINTEGLLLLTNDGGLARVLELPETGWLRRYRVRAFGRTTQDKLDALKDGVTIDGFAYGGIEATIERQQSDNVWLMIGLREGKNREVKRVAEHLGLAVNRLIRVSFGPFQLGDLGEGAVEEVRTRVLQDQLGKRLIDEAGCDFEAEAVSHGEDAPVVTGGRGAGRKTPDKRAAADQSRLKDPSQRVGRKAPLARPRDVPAPPTLAEGETEERPTRTKRAPAVADRKGRAVKVERVARAENEPAPRRARKADPEAAERFGAPGRAPRPPRPGAKPGARDGKPAGRSFKPREGDEARGPRGPRADGERRGPSRGDRPDRGDRPQRSFGDRPARAPSGDRPDRGERPARSFGDRPARAPSGDRPDRGERPARSFGDRPARAPSGDRPRPAATAEGGRRSEPRWRSEDAPRSERPRGDRPQGDRPQGDRPQGARPQGDRPRTERSGAGKAFGDRPPRRDGDRPYGDKPRGERPQGDRPQGSRPPRSDAPRGAGGKPAGRSGGKPGGFGGKPGGSSGKPGGRPGGKPGGFKPSGGGGGRGRPGGADRRG
ncbi:23S rRNA pseudouridine2605 synthase [Methylopila capsulata]|uniref:Pseudouridine synthase n=1 Tax=Methylopila capsulata TaxID=61654 RepID=A0A9W6IWX1_9HYPH|nr:pseudouridine synthase [Methylopila capsulata]MBM7852562.1 23S rRNA pseudouridine2605 synthase [Methylopila capsulata]GLK56769.1 pseudouridine synthase [Methylopila capsulata]